MGHMIQNCLSCKLIDKMNVMFARRISAGIVSCTTVMQEDHKKTMNTAKYFHVGLRPYVGQVRELKNSQNMVKSISKAAADDIERFQQEIYDILWVLRCRIF